MCHPQKWPCSALLCVAVALLLVATSLQQVALGESTRVACPLSNRFCQLQPRFSFGSAVIENKAYYHGGLDANNETRPWADEVLEVVDLDTLEAATLPLPPAEEALLTRRYRHVMVPLGSDLIMAGGQVDDKNGLGNNTLNVLGLALNTRQFVHLRTFGQPGGKADVVFYSVELVGDALSFVVTTIPHTNAVEAGRALRLLNLATDKLVSAPNTLMTPMYLAYPLLSHASLKGDGLPPYLVLEAQRDVTPDIITDIVKFAADRKGSLVAQVANPLEQDDRDALIGPLPIIFNLPKGLAPGPAAKDGDSDLGDSGFTLAMQLMPEAAEGQWKLVMWTRSQTVWVCDECPPGVKSGRSLVPVSLVSIWNLTMNLANGQLRATPVHLVVGVPLGLDLKQLVSLRAPFLNTVRVIPGLLASGLLSSMPYVGEVDLNLNSDPSNVALTATHDGFVVRGTSLAPLSCPLYANGKQAFFLRFMLRPKGSPVVTGGSPFTSGCLEGATAAVGTVTAVTNGQMECGAGVGMYGVSTGGGRTGCMTWDPKCRQVYNEFWEYKNDGKGAAVLMNPSTRVVEQLVVRLPKDYPYATSRAACVFNNSGEASLYVEYGGKPFETRGLPKQEPVSAMYAMRLTTPAPAGWQMTHVAGDGALPKLAAAAMACGPDSTAYIFGGMEDRGTKNMSVMVPTATLVKVKFTAGGANSYALSATTLAPRGRGPAPRSNHVLLYLEPSLSARWGASQGALLLHGGSNLDNTYFNETRGNANPWPWQKGFQMYADTWLFDLGRNSWRLLTGVTTPVPLMWHGGAVHIDPASGVKEVVLFGGTTYDRAASKLDQSVNLMQLDLTDHDLTWRSIPMSIVVKGGGKDTLKTKFLNSAVCTLPNTTTFLVRQQKDVSATAMPRTWELSGSSKEVVEQWQKESVNMSPGDVVKVAVSDGILQLEEPLVVPGVLVVPDSVTGAGGGRRLHQAAKAPASGGASEALAGGDMEAAPRQVLQVECRGDNSAFLVTAGGATLQDITISGCTNTSVNVISSTAGGAPVTLRRVTIQGGQGSDGTAVNISSNAEVLLEECRFTGNNASGHGSVVSAGQGTTLTLRDTNITSNNGSAVHFVGTSLTVTGSRLTGNAASVRGGGIYAAATAGGLARTRVLVTNSIVAGNRAGEAGGGIALGEGARLELRGSSMSRNSARVGGAVAGLLGSCLVSANDTSFTGNSARATGGAVHLQGSLCDGKSVRLLRVRFENNTAGSNGGGMCLQDISATKFNITNNTVIRNHAEGRGAAPSGMGGGLYAVLWASEVNLTGSQLINNTATASGAGLHLFGVNTSLNVVDTTFTTNLAGLPSSLPAGLAQLTPTRGGGVHVMGGSVVAVVASSIFQENGASLGAGMSFAPDVGQLRVINKTRFRFNQAASQGGGLLVSGGGTTVNATDTRFRSNKARAVQGAGGGLCCLQCKSAVLQRCRFWLNAATYGGGAALLQPAAASLVDGCNFTENTALASQSTPAGGGADNRTAAVSSLLLDGLYWPALWRQQAPGRALARVPLAANATSDSGAYTGGGGLYVSPTAAFNLSSTVFADNKAVNGGGLLGRTDFCPTKAPACMTLSRDNEFSNNTAVGGAGGALLVTNTALVQCVAGDTQYPVHTCVASSTSRRRRRLLQQQGQQQLDADDDTSALVLRDINRVNGGYGPDMASAATRIVVRNQSDPLYCMSNSSSNGSAALPPASPTVIRVAPGGNVNVSLHLKDSLDQCVFGSISDASMWLEGRLRYPNTSEASVALLGANVRASNGSATFTALQVYAQPGTYWLEIHSPSSPLLVQQLLPLEVRACVAGEFTQAVQGNYTKYNCILCNPGTYNFDPSKDFCPSCDLSDHAECVRAAKVPKPGYYQSHPRNPQIHACLWSGGCQRTQGHIADMQQWANFDNHTYLTAAGLSQTDMSGYMGTMCTPGYTGPLCGACAPNHGRVGFQCSRCFHYRWGHYLLYLLVWVYLFGMVVVAGWIHVREVMQRHQKRQAGATLQVLQPHLLGNLSRQPSEVPRPPPQQQGSVAGDRAALPPAYSGGKDAGMVMVTSETNSFFKPTISYKPSSSFQDRDSPWVCHSEAAMAAAPASDAGAAGSGGVQPQAGHQGHLSDSAADDTHLQKDAAVNGGDATAAHDKKVGPAAVDRQGSSRGTSSLSRAPAPLKRPSSAWRNLLSTEDLDEEDCLQLARAASEGELADGTGRPAAPSSVVVDRSEMFYISDVVKLGITHLQMLGIMRLMGLSWPSSAETMLTYADQTLPVVGWLNLDCISPRVGGLPRPLARVLLQLLVPVVAVGLVVGAWEVVRIIHRRRGVAHSYKQYYRPRLVLSVILLLFYLYPSVTNVAVGLLACSDVDTLHASNPKLRPEPAAAVYTGSYWMGETSVQCWTGPHLWMVVFLAIPYLLLFSLGFPLILVWRLYKHRYQLGCQSVELRFGVLYESYHCRYYYWECIVLVQKLVLILPVMLLQRKGQGLQVLLAMLVITGASILQITFQPYACKMLDTLQRASFHVLQITLFLLMVSALAGAGGIMDLAYDSSQSFTLNILPVIGVINGMLLVLFVYCFYLECKRFALHVLGRSRDEQLTWGDLRRLPKSILAPKKGSEEGRGMKQQHQRQQRQVVGGADDPLSHAGELRGPSKV